MFEKAKREPIVGLRTQHVFDELEARIAGGDFSLMEVIQEGEPWASTALGYLNGTGPHRRTGVPVTVTVEIHEGINKRHNAIVQNNSIARTLNIGGKLRTATVWEEDNPRCQTRYEAGQRYTLGMEQAHWILFNFGQGSPRMTWRPAKSRREWCHEVLPSEAAKTTTPTTTGKGRDRRAGAAA